MSEDSQLESESVYSDDDSTTPIVIEPKASPIPERPSDGDNSPRQSGGTYTIWLLEDCDEAALAVRHTCSRITTEFRNFKNAAKLQSALETISVASEYNTRSDMVPDLLIADLVLPDLPYSFLEWVSDPKRNCLFQNFNLPILVLTAYADERAVNRILESVYIDDLLSKPFNPSELRTKAKLLIEKRRARVASGDLSDRLSFTVCDQVHVDVSTLTISQLPDLVGEQSLTATEFKLLARLSAGPATRESLMEAVYGAELRSKNSLAANIARLRKKLQECSISLVYTSKTDSFNLVRS
jgi:DNA-binding response OmpR family regulator